MRKMWKCQNEIRLNFAKKVREVCVCVCGEEIHAQDERSEGERKKERRKGETKASSS